MSTSTLFFKVKGSYLFDYGVGYISVNSTDMLNTSDHYRRVISAQTDVSIDNVTCISRDEFEEHQN